MIEDLAGEVPDFLADVDWDGDEPISIRDEFALRDLLIVLGTVQAERERLIEIQTRILERYAGSIEAKNRQEQRIRQSLENYLLANDRQKVGFPDVGTVYLATVAKGGKVKVADAVAFEDWLFSNEHGDLAAYKQTLDVTKTLELTRDEFGFHATPEGKLVNSETGEVVEVPGVEVQAEHKALRIKRAA
jgi:hypothetical protein